jgi:hypothetical protein
MLTLVPILYHSKKKPVPMDGPPAQRVVRIDFLESRPVEWDVADLVIPNSGGTVASAFPSGKIRRIDLHRTDVEQSSARPPRGRLWPSQLPHRRQNLVHPRLLATGASLSSSRAGATPAAQAQYSSSSAATKFLCSCVMSWFVVLKRVFKMSKREASDLLVHDRACSWKHSCVASLLRLGYLLNLFSEDFNQ